MHCVAKSEGSQIHENLDTDYIEAYFRKYRFEAAYSGFEGLLAPEDEVATGEHEPGADASEDYRKLPCRSGWMSAVSSSSMLSVSPPIIVCRQPLAMRSMQATRLAFWLT